MANGRRNIGLWIGIGIVVVLVLFVVGMFRWYVRTYNRIVTLEEQVNNTWAQVENQFQRRYDLIPNLVNTVKGYAEHEKGVLTEVTEARAKVGAAQSVGEKIDANQELSSALSRLMVVVENYPNLKANQNFLDLQAQLEGTENRISVERRRYNEAVRNFNTFIRLFPNSFVANSKGFSRKEFFKAEEGAAKAPKVEF
jgi:LemA protein